MGKRQEEMKKLGLGEVLQLCWTKGKPFLGSACSTFHAVCAVECRSSGWSYESHTGFSCKEPLLGQPPFSDTRWQNTTQGLPMSYHRPTKPEQRPLRTWQPCLFWVTAWSHEIKKETERHNLKYVCSQSTPGNHFFLILHFHLINKKVKTLASLTSSSSALGKTFSWTRLASPADPVNTASKFPSMPLTYFHLASVWCIRSDSPAVTGHLHHCRHDNSERQSMIPYPGHPIQRSLSVQSHWV